ncbi:hypothetical protein T05_9700 [Trichinella murrelli]|uniref:Uncharacterized protein n=2 Tax=Trichinella TaxID=6333 RepID=A0A0V0TPG5_9BILA|nr:hypothetical protein T05_9700 [Trichinella murrelli]
MFGFASRTKLLANRFKKRNFISDYQVGCNCNSSIIEEEEEEEEEEERKMETPMDGKFLSVSTTPMSQKSASRDSLLTTSTLFSVSSVASHESLKINDRIGKASINDRRGFVLEKMLETNSSKHFPINDCPKFKFGEFAFLRSNSLSNFAEKKKVAIDPLSPCNSMFSMKLFECPSNELFSFSNENKSTVSLKAPNACWYSNSNVAVGNDHQLRRSVSVECLLAFHRRQQMLWQNLISVSKFIAEHTLMENFNSSTIPQHRENNLSNSKQTNNMSTGAVSQQEKENIILRWLQSVNENLTSSRHSLFFSSNC